MTSVSEHVPSKSRILLSTLVVSSQTSIVTQRRLSVNPLVSILTIFPNWSCHSHFAWLTSVETVKTLPDKHKCFPGFVWPISAWSWSTCFSYRRNSRENIGSTRNERIVMMESEKKWKPLNCWAGLQTVNRVSRSVFFFSSFFLHAEFETLSFWLVCCNKTVSDWLLWQG